ILEGNIIVPRVDAPNWPAGGAVTKSLWYLDPSLAADSLGAQDTYFYSYGLPSAPRMQPHMFAQLRSFIFWSAFGPEWGKKAAPALAVLATMKVDGAQAARFGAPRLSCQEGTFSNPDGISDGCPGAPAGTPNNITLFQHTNYFNGYANQD